MIEGLVARGVVTGGHPAFQRALVWCGPFRPRIIPRPEGGERGDNERGDKVETWMFLL